MDIDHKVILTIGEVVVDWISLQAGPNFVAAVDFRRALGGNAINVAVALSRLGASSRLIGQAGVDRHGHFIRRQLKHEKVDDTFLLDDHEHPTAQCYAVRDDQDEASYYNWPRPNAADMLCEDDIKFDAFENAAGIHATGISLSVEPRKSAVLKALALAKSKSVLVSFDAGFPTDSENSKADAKKAFALADVIKINLAELLFWTGVSRDRRQDFMRALTESNYELSGAKLTEPVQYFMSEHKPQALLLTLGEQGSVVITDRLEVYCQPHAVASQCSIGAGDAYIGGILYELVHRRSISPASLSQLNESDWRHIGSFGNAVGALATRGISAVETLPTATEVAALLDAGHSRSGQ